VSLKCCASTKSACTPLTCANTAGHPVDSGYGKPPRTSPDALPDASICLTVAEPGAASADRLGVGARCQVPRGSCPQDPSRPCPAHGRRLPSRPFPRINISVHWECTAFGVKGLTAPEFKSKDIKGMAELGARLVVKVIEKNEITEG
jgi:hypothetical protein